MSRFRSLVAAPIVSAVAVLALAGTALADTSATITVGPIPVPGAPVSVCVNQTDIPGGLQKCVTTPGAQTVTLVVNAQVATPNPTVTPPTVTPIPCPAGTQGAAAQVTTGSDSAAITGSATVTLNNGTPTTVPISQVVAGPNKTVTVYACAGVA